MNLAQLLAMHSGEPVIAMCESSVLNMHFDAGTVGRIYVSQDDDVRHYMIKFTSSLRLDLSFFNLRNWEKLKRCGSCARNVPENTLTTCSACCRPDYCGECFTAHPCTTPAVGPSRRPRKQRIINELKEHNAERTTTIRSHS